MRDNPRHDKTLRALLDRRDRWPYSATDLPTAVASATAPARVSMKISKPYRMIVLTDIGAEVDDTESMVRLLLYSDVIDIQGLIATTSTWKRTSVSPELIHGVIGSYSKVHGNLVKHDTHYPPAEVLHLLVKHGRAEYGMSGVGAGKDSEGSNKIIETLERNDDRPLWITIWGGANTLAQSLYKLRATKPAAEVDRLIAKLRVYTISDQDDSGPWIRKSFPSSFTLSRPEAITPPPRGPESIPPYQGSITRQLAPSGWPNTFNRGTGRWAPRIRTLPTAWKATRHPGSR